MFHAISWGWPVLSVILVAIYNVWGWDDGATTAYWCWININAPHATTWRLIAGKAVEWTSCVFITIMYIFVFFDLRKKVDQSPATQLLITHRTGASWKSTEKKLLAIPFIFVILRLPGTVRTVYEAVNQHPLDSEFVAVLQAIGDSGQGFANGLLFGVFTGKVRSFYRKLIASCASSGPHTSSLNFYGKVTNKDDNSIEYPTRPVSTTYYS